MTKIKEDKNINLLIDATFLDKNGKKKNVKDVIKHSECWNLKKENIWILNHSAIEKIAQIAGISKNYDVEESKIKPDITNEFEHIVRVTIKCNAKKLPNGRKDSCVHDDENFLTITGEANRLNTVRGIHYLRKMAEKRGYDIAVLKHLGLYTSAYSEEEAEDFKKNKEDSLVKEMELTPGTEAFEQITGEMNEILNSKTPANFQKVLKKIKENKKKKVYTNEQFNFLKDLHTKKYAEYNKK